MPNVFQNTINAATRSRRPRGESESHRPNAQRMDSSSTGSASRRKESRNPDRRSPPSKSTSPSASMYSHPNITHDTPVGPSSGENSPISPRSPELRPEMKSTQVYPGPGGFFQLTSEHQVPAALLQYLDTEDEDAVDEPLTKAKTESLYRPSATGPGLRSQPTVIQNYREKENSNLPPLPARKEIPEPTARPRHRISTSRPRPQSAFIQSYDVRRDESDETPMSEPESSAKATVTAARLRRQVNIIPGNYTDSSTDGTDATSSTDGATDDEHDNTTPRPIRHGPSTLPAQVPPGKLERTSTAIHHGDLAKLEPSLPASKSTSATATPRSSSRPARPSQVPNAFQFLQDDADGEDVTTPQPQKQDAVPTAAVTAATTKTLAAIPKPQPSLASQYFGTQQRIAPPQTLKREHSDPGSKTLLNGQAPKQPDVLQYLDKEEKRPVAQPIQRVPSNKSARSPPESHPPLPASLSAFLDKEEKKPQPQPIQREPSNKSTRSPDVSHPSLPVVINGHSIKDDKKIDPTAVQQEREFSSREPKSPDTSRSAVSTILPVQATQPAQDQSVAQPPPVHRSESIVRSPVMTTRPLAHVFPAHHYQDVTPPTQPAQQSRKSSHEGSTKIPSAPPPAATVQTQYPPVLPPSLPQQQSMIPSRPLTPESSDFKDDSETVTGGSPAHMSVSMPHLLGAISQADRFAPIGRTFTPPGMSNRDMEQSNMVQPMPVYPYNMQDPRLYYSTQYQNMQQGHPYMVEPQYNYAAAPPPPPALPPAAPPASYFNSSPDPFRRHRMSLASVGGESRSTPEAIDPNQSLNQTRPATGRASPLDESVELLSRIQHALPDLQLLLSRCEEVTGQHKETVKQVAASPDLGNVHQEALRHKTARIEELEKELQTKSQAHATERNRMRFEIGNLQEQYRDLQDELVAIQKRRKSSDQNPTQLILFRNEVQGLRKELEESLARQRELSDAKLFVEQSLFTMEAQLKALNAELDAKKLAEAAFQSKFNETMAAHSREREAWAVQGKTEQRQIEDKQFRDRRELEAALRSREEKLEEIRLLWAKEKEELQRAWQKEKEDMQSGWQREKEELTKSHSKDKEEQSKQHGKDKDELQRTHMRDRDELVRAHEDTTLRLKAELEKETRNATRRQEKALAEQERSLEAKFDDQFKDIEQENTRLRRDYKRVKRDWHLDKERGREEREKLRGAAVKMQTEHNSLIKLLEVYSEPTERDKEREEKRERREKEHQSKKDDASSQQG